MKNKAWYTISETAQILGVDEQTLRRWERDGRIPCIRTKGGQRRFRREDLEHELGHPIPEEPVDKVDKAAPKDLDRPKEKDPLEAKKHQIEMAKLNNELKKEELELIRINKEKEDLLADKIEAEKKMEREEEKSEKLESLIRFGTYFLYDRLPERLAKHGLPSRPAEITLVVRVQNEIYEMVEGSTLTGDIYPLKKQIETQIKNILDERIKKELIEYVRGILSHASFPGWMGETQRKMIRTKIQDQVELGINGTEHAGDLYQVVCSHLNAQVKLLDEQRQKELWDAIFKLIQK